MDCPTSLLEEDMNLSLLCSPNSPHFSRRAPLNWLKLRTYLLPLVIVLNFWHYFDKKMLFIIE